MKETDDAGSLGSTSANREPRPEKPSSWYRLVMFALILSPALVLGGIGGYAFMKARESIKLEVQQSLTTIADQKSRQIELWLSNISEDASLFCDRTPLARMVEKWILSGKRDAEMEKMIRLRLEQIRSNRHYSSLAVFDAQAQLVQVSGSQEVQEHSKIALEVIRQGVPQFIDLHKNSDGSVELGVIAPLINEAGHVIGALYLAGYAEDFLYPLLASWPVSHATAETILVERESDKLLYVSPLHLLNIPALAKRVPLGDSRLPAAAGVNGFRGIYENGWDYRGKKVLSYLAAIEGTPWVMVAKIDNDEAYAKIHRLGWLAGGAFGIALFVCYLIAWLGWRNQGLKHQLAINQTLRKSDARYRLLTETMEDVIWVLNIETQRFDYISPSVEKLRGYSLQEIMSLPALVGFPDNTREYFEGLIQERVMAFLAGEEEGSQYFTVEFEMPRKDGSLIWVESVSQCQLNPLTQKVEVFGLTRNISDRKRAEASLRESEARYRAIVDNAPLSILAVQEGRYVFANPAAAIMAGYSVQELIGMSAMDVIHPDSSVIVQERMSQLDRGFANTAAEISLLRKDGSIVITESTSVPITLDGKPAFLILGQDITGRKLAEAQLQALNSELEQRVLERTAELQSVLDTTQDGFDIVDSTGHLLKVNPAACRMLGYSETELLKLSISDIEYIENPEETQRHIEKIMREGVDLFETKLRCKDGQIIDAEISVIFNQHQGGLFYTFFRNITERKRLENELREAVERLSLATKAAELGIWDWMVQEDRLVWDDRMYALYGIRQNDFANAYSVWTQAVHPDDRQRADEEIQNALMGLSEFQTEFRVVWPDKSVRHIMAFGRVIRDENSRPLRMIGINLDITRRIQAEQELAEKESRWLVALESHDMGVWDWNIESGSVYRSPRWNTMLGYSEEDIGDEINDREWLVHPEDKSLMLRSLEEYFQSASPHYQTQFRLLCKDGQYRWIYSSGKVVEWSAEGKPLRMIGTHTDIDEQKKIQDALRKSRERLDFALRNSQIGAWEMNLRDLTTERTPIHDRIYGYETMLPKWTYQIFLDHVLPDDRTEVDRVFQAAVKDKKEWNFEYRIRRDDGEVRWIYAAGGHMTDPDGNCEEVSGIVQDVTERKLITEKLAKAKEDAEVANRAKSTFLANMSHEIRTPLNGILGKVQLIQTEKLDDKIKRQIQSISESALHLLSIVNDILDISKIEAGKLNLELADFSVRDKVEAVLFSLADKAEAMGVQLNAVIDPELPEFLRGDKKRVRQILFNLVGNAVKFTQQGSVTVRVLRLEPGDEGFMVRFEVQDTGPGISYEDQGRLFHLFEQVDNKNTRHFGGTGLGLAICKRLVEQMGGSIGIDSKVGVGSTFWFRIPLSKGSITQVESNDVRLTDELARQLAENFSDARILLVEDNELNQDIVIEMLQEVNMTVDLAINGKEAVKLATNRKYDLILMDIQMPIMDGLEATRLIRSLPDGVHVPIVALTANAFKEDIDHYLSIGMNAHIAKPIIMGKLYEAMFSWLGSKSAAITGMDAVNGNPLSPDISLSLSVPRAKARGEGETNKLASTPFSQRNELNSSVNSTASKLMARIDAIPGMDTQIGLNCLGGKESSYKKMLIKFADRQTTDMDSLRNSLAQDDLVTAKRIAHTLKGLAGTMGATQLQARAQALDAAFREELGLEEINRLTEIVVAEYASLAESILAIMNEP